ncbi:hypothetical protein FACS189431_0180 [Alphaproteobacteria bacterium]|nr:hypothetical protein FACS189431_0180 [Alphaproteobacteria bacterium]
MAEIVKANLKELRMTPRKVSEVIALVRDRSVDDALVILSHTPRRTAKPVTKLIESARANAVNNHGLLADSLRIEEITVTAGPRLKRYKPVSRGMAHPFQKRTSNISVTLVGDKKPAKKPAAVTASVAKQSSKKEESGLPRRSASRNDETTKGAK